MKPLLTLAKGATLVVGLSFSLFASAQGWTVAKHPLGPGYTVSNGTFTVDMPDQKSAEKAADALNDADKAMDKKNKKDDKRNNDDKKK